MKLLKDILYKVPLEAIDGSTERQVNQIQFDSRKAEKGDLFVAVRGTNVDGHQFISSVVEKGVVAVICEQMPENISADVTFIVVRNSALSLGVVASNYYGCPSNKLALTGVTGTNGKTTTVTLLFELFRKLGYNTGLLSTVENKINEDIIPATHTTPDPVALNKLLDEMVRKGCTHAFMEVSSHSIDQERIAGLVFSGGVFTNISHDHLDYHKTFDRYIKAKKHFFDLLPKEAFALANADDKRGTVMLQNTQAAKHYFGLKTLADFKGKIFSNTLEGIEMEIEMAPVWFQLIGYFNAYNILAVYATAMLLGEDHQEVLTNLSEIRPVRGRFEQVFAANGVTGIVDYAHTPDALENVLTTINELKNGNKSLITVVGCGGDRDKAKRPVMTDIACKNSDKVILTTDNPRNESPADILQEMKTNLNPVHKKKILTIEDRREAIRVAVSLAAPGDVILVAGKGHETYQEVKGIRHHFDDKEELEQMFHELNQ